MNRIYNFTISFLRKTPFGKEGEVINNSKEGKIDKEALKESSILHLDSNKALERTVLEAVNQFLPPDSKSNDQPHLVLVHTNSEETTNITLNNPPALIASQEITNLEFQDKDKIPVKMDLSSLTETTKTTESIEMGIDTSSSTEIEEKNNSEYVGGIIKETNFSPGEIQNNESSNKLEEALREVILSEKELELLKKIRTFIQNKHSKDINIVRIRSKIEKLGYNEMIPNMRSLLTNESWRIGKNFLNEMKKLQLDRGMVFEMTNYAIQEILFKDQILKSHMLCSIRTKISFEEDFRLKEQCHLLQDKPFSFFEISEEMQEIRFDLIIKRLEEVELYDTPAQMRKVLLNILQTVTDELKRIGKKEVSADDLLPIIIYSFAHAEELQNPLMIMEYMQELSFFKGNNYGESAYSFLLFQSALTAIQQNLLSQESQSNCGDSGESEQESDFSSSVRNESDDTFQNPTPDDGDIFDHQTEREILQFSKLNESPPIQKNEADTFSSNLQSLDTHEEAHLPVQEPSNVNPEISM